LGEICQERLSRCPCLGTSWSILAQGWSFIKETGLIDIVEDEEPLSILFNAQPVMNKLKDIGLRILPTRDLDLISNIPIALLKTGCIARVNPENPRFRRSVSDLIRVFDGNLRLPARD
jgi:hypothetical protein